MSRQIYQRLQRVLGALGCDIGASECHGMLCGVLCGAARFDRDTWLRHVSGRDDLSPFQHGEPLAAVEELVDHTRDGLDRSDLSFAMLLPDDDRSLDERAVAFAGWCRGFLSGFGLSGIADLRVLGEDARGFLGDVERFGSLAIPDRHDEDDERAFTELTEFTRMGVLIVREEMYATQGAAHVRSEIH
jgi:uncharacterized protein